MRALPARLRSIPLALAISLAIAGCGGSGNPKAFPEVVSPDVVLCPSSTTELGMDVSSFQGAAINWPAAADSGVTFAIAKATEGLTIDDADFKTNWAGMADAGVVRGAYHFFHPQDDGTAQADYFLAQVGTLGEPGDLPPALDWELTDTQVDGGLIPTATVIAEAQKFIDEIKLKTGLDTIIYTYASYWHSLGSPAQFAMHPLWYAAYNGPLTACPSTLAPWTTYAIWQWAAITDGGTPANPFHGVNGEDLNVFNGTVNDLRGWSTPPIAQASGNSALTVINWPDQHAELFGRSPAGALLDISTSGSTDAWTSNPSLGSGVACGTAAAFFGAPGLYPDLYAPLQSGTIGEALWSSGSWNALADFGGAGFTDLSATVGMDGQARVFALGADGAIWFNQWTRSGGAWSGWSSLGGSFITGPASMTWGNGTIELFAIDSAGELQHLWTTSSGWSTWTTMGTQIASHPAAVRWSDGTVGHAEVFARGADNQLYHSEFSLTSGWPASASVVSAGSEIIGEPSAFMNASGSSQSGPEVVARDATGRVLHLARSGTGYTNFAPLGDQLAASDPFGWVRADGTAEVFAIDLSGQLVRTLRDASGNWGAWSAIATGFDPCAPPLAIDGGDDAGTNADAGEDAGSDGGFDAGTPDAGTSDAGNDAGAPDGGASDAGHTDAGSHDAGSDGGSLTPAPSGGGCSGGNAGPAALLGLAFALGLRRRSWASVSRSGAAD